MRPFPCCMLLVLITLASGVQSAAAQDLPPPGDLRIVVLGDLNSSYGSTAYAARVDSTIGHLTKDWSPDLVLIAGDMIAGQSEALSDEHVRRMWATFDQRIAEPLRNADIPLGFTLGNHDASAHPSFGRDRDLAEEYWHDPSHDLRLNFVDTTFFPFYYSFRIGELFVLSWDASSAAVQNVSWVRQALASPEAEEAQMKIVIGHLPLFAVSEGRNRPGEVLSEAEDLQQLLEAHEVDLYISGHHHAYYTGRRDDLDLLSVGALGEGSRPLLGRQRPSPHTVTVLDLDFEKGRIRNTTLEAPALEPIDTVELPRLLRGFNGYLLRRDMPLED